MRKYIVFVLAIPVIFNIIGCKPGKDSGGKVIAQINGREIRDDEFKERFSRLSPSLKGKYSDEKGKKEFLEEIIKRELLLQEARKVGIEKERTIIDRIEEMRERMILNEFLQHEVEDKLTITDKELEDFFNLHKDEFKSPDEVKISQIVVRSEGDANEVLRRLHGGADFARTARELSVDAATRNNGGEIGLLQKGKVHPELDAVIFNMNEGEISDPIKTESGYHIIRLQKKIEGKPLSFNDAKGLVGRRYHLEKRNKAFEDLFARLKAKASINISEENLKGAHIENIPSNKSEK